MVNTPGNNTTDNGTETGPIENAIRNINEGSLDTVPIKDAENPTKNIVMRRLFALKQLMTDAKAFSFTPGNLTEMYTKAAGGALLKEDLQEINKWTEEMRRYISNPVQFF